jgi:hypothetical protein
MRWISAPPSAARLVRAPSYGEIAIRSAMNTGPPGRRAESRRYNGKTALMICCPLTTRIKGYPFECRWHSRERRAPTVKSLDWQARRATRNSSSGRSCAR